MHIQNENITTYDPGNFPGLQWKASIQDKKTGEWKDVKNLIFESGMWLIIGALHMRVVNEVYYRLRKIAVHFAISNLALPVASKKTQQLNILLNDRFRSIVQAGGVNSKTPEILASTLKISTFEEKADNFAQLRRRVAMMDQSATKNNKKKAQKRKRSEQEQVTVKNEKIQKKTQNEDAKGYSPLMKAVSRGNYDNVKLLLKIDADPSYATDDGETALTILDEKDSKVFTKIRLLLLKHLVPKNLRKEAIGK